MLVTPG
jgi:hypothetical protein